MSLPAQSTGHDFRATFRAHARLRCDSCLLAGVPRCYFHSRGVWDDALLPTASVMMPKYAIAAALLARGTARDELKEIQAEVRANAGVDGDQSFGRRGRRVHPQDNVADPEDASMQCTQGAEGAGGASAQLTQAAAPI